MNVGSDAVRKRESFDVFTRTLAHAVGIARGSIKSRIVKLMAAGRGPGGTEDGGCSGLDFAIAEINQAISHFDPDGNDSSHLCAIDRLRKIHQAAAFRIKSAS